MAVIELTMPHMGVSVTEGVLLAWHKSEGDEVRADEAVCDVATDKVDTEVVAPQDAVIAKILVAAGETVEVGAPLAQLTTEGEPVPASAEVAAPAETDQSGTAADGGSSIATPELAPEQARAPARARGDRILASPVARRMALQHDIPLDEIAGTGTRGRIRKADVEARVAAQAAPSPAGASAPAPAGDLPAGYADVPYEIVATSYQRRAIAEHMVRSRHTAAHMTTEVEVDMHRLTMVRAAMNSRELEQGRRKLSYLPFITRATCAALADYPDLNATFDGDRLIRWRTMNVGIAVDTEKGLMAPVVRSCETLNVVGIAERIADLADRARSGKLTPDDMRGGTFTISNPGSVGAVSAMAIINQPQVAILGLPKIVRRPTVVAGRDGEELVAIRPILLLALTFDHRALDGADATRAAVRLKDHLESWDEGDYA